ncbi:MAG: hypothetical protein ACJ750_06175 [Gaiellaceae bacterium]
MPYRDEARCHSAPDSATPVRRREVLQSVLSFALKKREDGPWARA